MPILLDDLTSAAAVKSYSPQFFDSKLTGTGKSTGLLQPHRNPGHTADGTATLSEVISCRHHHTSNNGVTTTYIPVYTVPAQAWPLIKTVPIPSDVDMICIAEKDSMKLYLSMDVHAMNLEEQRDDTGTNQRKLKVSYQIRAFAIDTDPTTGKAFAAPEGDQDRKAKCFGGSVSYTINNTLMTDPPNPGWIRNLRTNKSGDTGAYIDITSDVKGVLDSYMSFAKGLGWKVHVKDALDWFNSFDIYTSLCRRSELWQTSIDEQLNWLFENLGNVISTARAQKKAMHAQEIEHMVIDQLHAIEDYKIPLDLYRNIYEAVTNNFDPDLAERLCKENLSLLLSDTLHKLDEDKPNLEKMPHTTATADPMFSPEQKAAIESYEPLILVQSGAGSGKSSVVGARIKQMVEAGVDPKDITVLSFTNAAADHIKEINEDVHSMTIASMVHSIYEMNYPGHQLSTLHTLMNSIEITYGSLDETAKRFRACLLMLAKSDANAVIATNTFIEENFDEVMAMLDELGQTTLEIEIIVAYQKIGELTEPDFIQSRHLIIDEVQDNSIFEFIYVLKYVAKHKESLFFVGK